MHKTSTYCNSDYNAVGQLHTVVEETLLRKVLDFSNAIASVRGRDVISEVLTQQLNNLLGINEYVIYTIQEGNRNFSTLLYDAELAFENDPEAESYTPVDEEIIHNILRSDEPVNFYWRKRLLEDGARLSNIENIDQKANVFTGISIRLGNENIAFMVFRRNSVTPDFNHHNLLKSLCSQIAITVSNIIANEKIIRQFNEINSYKQQLEDEKFYLKDEIDKTYNYSEIVGDSPEIKHVFDLVDQVASSCSTVLLLGETGTGKELIARAIHNNSPRKDKLMVKVNCAALPVNLIESELFGHERGSFTGATDRRLGKFELANEGTLFLDEIGEMPLESQVKLLRAIQEREIERIGGRNTIKVNVRIIAATNRDLEREMIEGRFRTDLFYRLNIFPIYIPPLRDRLQDIPALTNYFTNWFSKKAGKKINAFSKRALQELSKYSWPGNVRELEHLIERSVLLSTGDTIKQIHLPIAKNRCQSISENFCLKTVDENERDHIVKTLNYCKGRIAGRGSASDYLGIPASTLTSKMKRLGIRKEHLS